MIVVPMPPAAVLPMFPFHVICYLHHQQQQQQLQLQTLHQQEEMIQTSKKKLSASGFDWDGVAHLPRMLADLIEHIALTASMSAVHDAFFQRLKKRRAVFTEVILKTLFHPLCEYLQAIPRGDPLDAEIQWVQTSMCLCALLSFLIENEGTRYDPVQAFEYIRRSIPKGADCAAVLLLLTRYDPCRFSKRAFFGRINITFCPERTQSVRRLSEETYVRTFRQAMQTCL